MPDRFIQPDGSKTSNQTLMNSGDEDFHLSKLEEEILNLLTGRELYGLQIVEAFAEVSQGTRKVGIGTLYPTLSRLEKRGLVISRMEDRPKNEGGGARRKFFRITQEGMHALVAAENFRKSLYRWQPAT
jgi:DNA-binding PadR family transcriptional regulator